LVALFPKAGLQSFRAGLHRLHQTEIRLEAVWDFVPAVLDQIGHGFRALLGGLLPRFLFVDDRRFEISLLSPARFRVCVRKNHEILQEHMLDDRDGSLAGLIASLATERPSLAAIYATPGCVLRKTVEVPAGIRGNQLHRSLEYLLEVETPFRRDQVYWGFRAGPRRRAGTRFVDLVLVPRSTVDPHATVLREHGIHLLELSYREDVASGAPICLVRDPEPRERSRRRLTAALGLAITVQVVAIAAMPIGAQTIQASHYTDETARLSGIAADLGGLRSALEKRMAPVRQAQLDIQSFPSSSAVLRVLETELGTDTVLDRLSLRGTAVQAAGSTARVDVLTERLEKSQRLKPKSITRNGAVAAGQQELFSISLELGPAKGQ
jgi:hypothetical protein